MSAFSRSRGLSGVVRRVALSRPLRSGVSTFRLSPASVLVPTASPNALGRCHIQAFCVTTKADSLLSAASAEPKEDYFSQDDLDIRMHRLNESVSRTGRVTPKTYRLILADILSTGRCSANHALMLIRCCGARMVDESAAKKTEMAQDLWRSLEGLGASLDSSHYNALLRVHVENEHDFVPSEFLKTMEESGVEVNRVTYQHLIAKYCQNGDIAGATVILEHMKEKQMTVNENVFHSLIIGHCRSGDFSSARDLLPIMEASDLTIGSETRILLLKEMAKAGKPGSEIVEEFESCDVAFGDSDIFGLIVELVRSGNVETAKEFATKLPKKTGFFQEMRNHIPELVRLGEIDIPFDVLMGFKVPNVGGEGHEAARLNDGGIFFLNCLVKVEYPPEKVVKLMEKMNVGNTGELTNRLLECCVEEGKVGYGQTVGQAAREAFGEDFDKGIICSGIWLANRSKDLKTSGEAIRFWCAAYSVGLKLVASQVTRFLLPVVLSDPQMEPVRVIHEVINGCKDNGARFPPSFAHVANNVFQYLLNTETTDAFHRAVKLALGVRLDVKPHLWASSLARSFLATGDVESFVDILVFSSPSVNRHLTKSASYEEMRTVREADLYSALVQVVSFASRYSKGADVLEPVLSRLLELRVGMPPAIAETLRRSGLTDSGIEMTHQLEAAHAESDDYWTSERANVWYGKRCKRVAFKKGESFVEFTSSGQVVDASKMPKTLDEAKRLREVLVRREQYNSDIDVFLIEKLFEENRPDEAEETFESIKAIRKVKSHFIPYAVMDAIVLGYMGAGDHEKAWGFLQAEVFDSDYGRCFSTTYFKVIKAYFAAGKVDEGIEILRAIDKSKLRSTTVLKDVSHQVLLPFIDSGDEANLERTLDVLDELKLIDKTKGRAFSSFVELHLRRGDVEAAVQTFEKLAKEKSLVPYRAQLMKALIESMDMERMQRVLDASIEAIGEEHSLYDLAMSFLDMGRTAQAKKLLETPGLRYNHVSAQRIVDRFIQRNKLEALEEFVRLTVPVFACNREFLYSKLVSAYGGNVAKIKEIWVQMQEEGFVPSNELTTQMAEAFRMAGEAPPFQAPDAFAETSRVERRQVQVERRQDQVERRQDQLETVDKPEDSFPSLIEGLMAGGLEPVALVNRCKKLLHERRLTSQMALQVVEALASKPELYQELPSKYTLHQLFNLLTDEDNAKLGHAERQMMEYSHQPSKAMKEGGIDGFIETTLQHGRNRSNEDLFDAIKLYPAAVERLQDLSEKMNDVRFKAKLVMCFALSGNLDEARPIHDSIKGKEAYSTIGHRPGVDFATGKELRNLYEFLVENNDGSDDVSLSSLAESIYNRATRSLIREGDAASAQELFDRRVDSKPKALNHHSNFNLDAVVRGRLTASDDLIEEAKKILSKRRDAGKAD